MLQALDRDSLKSQFAEANPFPFVKIDQLLQPAFAEEVAASYPLYEAAKNLGTQFNAVNERSKIQITDSKLFPAAVAKLNEVLASQAFLQDLSYITGIPNLIADEELNGGGMHMTGPGGRLDVHVDFNYLESRKLHRRLNLLLYLNPVWDKSWGGEIQLWDKEVKTCCQAYVPAFNRCVVFETSEISFHGVTPVSKNASSPRFSFAAYYYTREAPPHWNGMSHSTVFKARPEERLRGYVLMPVEVMQRKLLTGMQHIKREIKNWVNPAR